MRDQHELFKSLVKKNPELQKILDNILETSNEEIEALSIQAWMKKEFMFIKSLAEEGKRMVNLKELLEKCVIETRNPDYEGYVYKWLGEEKFIKAGRTELLIRPNDLVFLNEHGLFLDTATINLLDTSKLELIKKCKLSEYRDMVNQLIYERYPEMKALKDKKETEEQRKGLTVKKYDGEYPPDYQI